MYEGIEVTAAVGAVATESVGAARAGARGLLAGGNAMDAAAAACLVNSVVYPHFSDLGGYVCAATVLEGATGHVFSLDANCIAPAAAREDMFDITARVAGKVGINEHEYDCSVAEDANVFGPLSVAPPGFVAGVGVLWEKWGRLKWKQIVAAALDVADNGVHYGDTAAAVAKRLSIVRRYEASAQLLLEDAGPPAADDIWHRPDLVGTLQRLATAGWRDFYEGDLGRRIGDHVSAIGGAMTRADMAAFEPRIGRTLETRYLIATVHGADLPNGAISVLQILDMLECLDCVPLEQPQYWHNLAEVLKLAWRDRLRYLGDPAAVDVPVDRLLDKTYAAGAARTIRESPAHVNREGPSRPSASRHGTAHVSAADAQGNVVSVTISQGNPLGSCIVVPGTGFVLGHGMCRFDPRAGRPDSIAPGKRPLNNVCPLVIRTPDRDIAVGMRGGRRIVSVVAQMAHRLVDFDMSPSAAATSARIHTLSDEPIEYDAAVPFPFVAELARMGHELRAVDELGGTAHCAEVSRPTRIVRAGGSIGAAGV